MNEKNFYIEKTTLLKTETYCILGISTLFFTVALFTSNFISFVFTVLGFLFAILWPVYFFTRYRDNDCKKSEHITLNNDGIYLMSNNRKKKILWTDVDIVKYSKSRIIIYSLKAAPLTIVAKDIVDFDSLYNCCMEAIKTYDLKSKIIK